MLEKLTVFYEEQGISPFSCCSKDKCNKAKSPCFTEAKASYVGPHYEKGQLPRLLFLSLDSGKGCSDEKQRTIEAVRCQNLATDVETLPKNKHWYLTHEMALKLLCQFKSGLKIADTPPYFAHVNSAKCCQNKKNKGQADGTLFDECRRFIPEELRILKPDIVVTQGNWAKVAICKSFTVQKRVECSIESAAEYKRDAHYETGFIELEPGRCALWLQTYHPRARGYFYPQRKHCWPLYAKAVGQWMGRSWPETR